MKVEHAHKFSVLDALVGKVITDVQLEPSRVLPSTVERQYIARIHFYTDDFKMFRLWFLWSSNERDDCREKCLAWFEDFKGINNLEGEKVISVSQKEIVEDDRRNLWLEVLTDKGTCTFHVRHEDNNGFRGSLVLCEVEKLTYGSGELYNVVSSMKEVSDDKD